MGSGVEGSAVGVGDGEVSVTGGKVGATVSLEPESFRSSFSVFWRYLSSRNCLRITVPAMITNAVPAQANITDNDFLSFPIGLGCKAPFCDYHYKT